MTTPPLLEVRADAGPTIGVGHLARCLALVQAWIDRRGRATLVSVAPPDHWAARFRAEGCEVVASAAALPPADWCAIDGYELAGGDREGRGARVLTIDDDDAANTRGRGADLVVDQNLGADPDRYPLARSTLVGPRYALLRRELLAEVGSSRPNERARRVVVILGGSPTTDVRSIGDALVNHPRLAEFDVRLLSGTDDVGFEMAQADLAVAAAGTVSWELCMAGLPAVLVAVARNQQGTADRLTELGAATRAAPEPSAIVAALLTLATDSTRRIEMSRIGRSLVDGLGARRVTARLRGDLLSLRKAATSDANLLYAWANDPATRRASFSTAPIPWEDHVAWLAARMVDPLAATYIARDSQGQDVGLVRFDASGAGLAEVGVTVAPGRRGEGWGGALVDAGCRQWAVIRGTGRIEARIKAGNRSSVRAFVDADFDAMTSGDASVLQYARHFDGDVRRA